MTFQILALDPAPFVPLFALSDAELAERHIVRRVADKSVGFPCRVSLADADVGDTMLLLNHEHLPAASPYRSTHAIYVRESVAAAHLEPDTVPAVVARRMISARAFDADGMMASAEVVPGADVNAALDRLFADPAVVHVDLHNAAQGCFAARAVRG
ncbi:DUF1203 domain-containing protein [Sphingosinicellaceae bacterium]|nr:DUF1203 domain-containing protein [Sphingosinicellaceae bacterium]